MPILMFILKKTLIILAAIVGGVLYARIGFRIAIWTDEAITKMMVNFRNHRKKLVFKRP